MEWDEVFPPTNIRIKVDANNGDHVSSVIHELLHVVFYDMLYGRLDAKLDEVVILALERDTYEYVKKVPSRYLIWDQLINRKLSEDGGSTA